MTTLGACELEPLRKLTADLINGMLCACDCGMSEICAERQIRDTPDLHDLCCNVSHLDYILKTHNVVIGVGEHSAF